MNLSDEDVEKAINYLRDTATQAAQARANRLYLQQHLRTTKAMAMIESDGKTVADRENEALTSETYLIALDGYKVAVELDEKHRFLREAAIARLDCWRTASANLRGVDRVG